MHFTFILQVPCSYDISRNKNALLNENMLNVDVGQISVIRINCRENQQIYEAAKHVSVKHNLKLEKPLKHWWFFQYILNRLYYSKEKCQLSYS